MLTVYLRESLVTDKSIIYVFFFITFVGLTPIPISYTLPSSVVALTFLPGRKMGLRRETVALYLRL